MNGCPRVSAGVRAMIDVLIRRTTAGSDRPRQDAGGYGARYGSATAVAR